MGRQQGHVARSILSKVQVLVQVVLENESGGNGHHLGQSILALAELDIHAQVDLFGAILCLNSNLHDAAHCFETSGSTPLRGAADLDQHAVAILGFAVGEHQWESLVLDHAVGALSGSDLGVLHERFGLEDQIQASLVQDHVRSENAELDCSARVGDNTKEVRRNVRDL